ncbi:transmembrane protein, partial [Clarias magur]
MVNIGLRKVDDALVEKHPGLQDYAVCQSRAFMKGTGSFVIGTVSMFLAQVALQKRLKYPLKWNLLISVVASSVFSYTVTRRETTKCTELWVFLEKGEIADSSTS